MIYKNWTPEEIEILQNNYGKIRADQIAVLVNTTYQKVNWKAAQLRLKSNRNKLRATGWTEEQEEYLRNNYNKVSVKDVAEFLGRKLNSVFQHACKLNLTAKKGDDFYRVKKYAISQDLIDRYNAGEFLWKIQEASGITSAHIFRKAMIRHGVKLRTHKQIPDHHMAKLREGLRKGYAEGTLQKKLSAIRQGIPFEEWTGFKQEWHKTINTKAPWKVWRTAVFHRDWYTCVLCRTSGKKCGLMDPHHIIRKRLRPDLMFDVDNGVTLCRSCHMKVTHHEEDFIEQFQNYVVEINAGRSLVESEWSELGRVLRNCKASSKGG